MALDACSKSIMYGFTDEFVKKYVERKVDDPRREGGVKKQIAARLGHFGTIPLSVVTGVVDTVLGVGAGIPYIFARGKSNALDNFAKYHLQDGADELLARPYLNLLRTINPKAKIREDFGFVQKIEGTNHNGWLTSMAQIKIMDWAEGFAKSENFAKKHIVSRLTWGLYFVASVVTRVVDMALGTLAAIASLFTLGKIEGLNRFAYKTLRITGVVSDFFESASNMWNPHRELS